MNGNYGALRLWSTVLVVIGVAGVIFVVIGIIFAMIEAVTFGQAIAILLIGGPLAALFASWPIALGQEEREKRGSRNSYGQYPEVGRDGRGNPAAATVVRSLRHARRTRCTGDSFYRANQGGSFVNTEVERMAAVSFHIPQRHVFSRSNLGGRSPP